MKLFAFFSMIAFSISAHASLTPANVLTQPAVSDKITVTENKVETLQNWFSQGNAVTFDEVRGFYSGRCYMVNAPDSATNSFLMYGERETSKDGPGFPASEVKILNVQYDFGRGPADYFDSEENFEQNKLDAIEALRNIWDHVSTMNADQLSYTYDWEANGVADEMHTYVRYNDYVVDKWTAMYPQRYGNIGFKKPGDTLGMCYYFKKMGD